MWPFESSNKTLLKTLLRKVDSIMATQAELTAQVQAATTTLAKIGTETSTLLDRIAELTNVIANGPAVSPELQSAVDALTAQAKVVDDLVPDAPTP